MVDKTRMGKLHEEFIATQFGGSMTKGSGNQWSDPNDTRDNHHVVPFALSFQCKSTAGASLSVSRETMLKAVEEAGGELPALALRWYPNERLDHLGINDDWAALRTADLDEILTAARSVPRLKVAIDELDKELAKRAWDRELHEKLQSEGEAPEDEQPQPRIRQLEAALAEAVQENDRLQAEAEQKRLEARQDAIDYEGELKRMRGVANSLRTELISAQEEIEQKRLELVRAVSESGPPPGSIMIRPSGDWNPTDEELHQFELDIEAEIRRRQRGKAKQLDTTIVYAFRTGTEPTRMVFQGVRISPYGVREEFSVGTIRVERSMDNKPRLMVDDCLITRGEYWLDGVIQCRTYEPVLG